MQVTIRVTIPGKLRTPGKPSPRWKTNIFEAAKSLFIIKEALLPGAITVGHKGQWEANLSTVVNQTVIIAPRLLEMVTQNPNNSLVMLTCGEFDSKGLSSVKHAERSPSWIKSYTAQKCCESEHMWVCSINQGLSIFWFPIPSGVQFPVRQDYGYECDPSSQENRVGNSQFRKSRYF